MKTAILLLAAVAAAAAAASPMAMIRSMTAEQRATSVWSVLVAGSNTYSNYRHQSDICGMYQELHNMGIPDSKIIVLMYDDIANSYENPRPGVIINTPDGPDVYKGTPTDYTGNLVTAKNFVKILQGEAPAGGSGKKLKSTSQDNVFVFFSDHGGDDILAFPTGGYLTSKMLYDAITTMNSKKLFGKLVINIEACEAGSMFYKYTYPDNVYITTASPVAESSYAWQWDDSVNAYVSDVWSWYMLQYMIDGHDSDSLQDQYDYTEKMMSNWSQPCQYGDTSVAEMTLGEFYGTAKKHSQPASFPKDAVRAWDASLEAARRVHAKLNTPATAEKLRREVEAHERIDAMKKRLGRSFAVSNDVDPRCTGYKAEVGSCVSTLASLFRQECGSSHDYLDSVTALISGMCRAGVNVDAAARAIIAECASL